MGVTRIYIFAFSHVKSRAEEVCYVRPLYLGGALLSTCMGLPGWLHLSPEVREKSESHYSRKKGSEHFIKGDKLLLSENDQTSKSYKVLGVSQDLFRRSAARTLCVFLQYLCFSLPVEEASPFLLEELELYTGRH